MCCGILALPLPLSVAVIVTGFDCIPTLETILPLAIICPAEDAVNCKLPPDLMFPLAVIAPAVSKPGTLTALQFWNVVKLFGLAVKVSTLLPPILIIGLAPNIKFPAVNTTAPVFEVIVLSTI